MTACLSENYDVLTSILRELIELDPNAILRIHEAVNQAVKIRNAGESYPQEKLTMEQLMYRAYSMKRVMSI